jgi:pterin-4a-carbinolamine dehydratase
VTAAPDTKGLVHTFHFGTYAQGLAFVATVGALAEREQHHPDIELRHLTAGAAVVVCFRTHTAGNRVTARDREMMARVEALARPAAAASAAPAALSLEAFAEKVNAAVRALPDDLGKPYDPRAHLPALHKVFVSRVHRALPELGLDLAAFKARLVEAHRAGHLELGRADVVAEANRPDAAASEVSYRNATFHYVRARAPQVGALATFAARHRGAS